MPAPAEQVKREDRRYIMNATYLFKEETSNGQKKLRIGTRAEYEQIQEANKIVGKGCRRYFIREKSLDPKRPDLLIIEVDRTEYQKWNRENMARCRNYQLSKKYQHISMEDIVRSDNYDKCNEPTLCGPDSAYEAACDNILLAKLHEEMGEWKPWAGALLDAYLAGKIATCPFELAEQYGVSLQTARKYVRQFEQRLKIFLEGVSF